MNKYGSHRLSLILLIGIFALICWMRIPYISVPVLIVDEALYSEIANTILDGGLPYKDAWEQKPPGIYYLYAVVFALLGRNNLIAIHWMACLAVIFTSLGLYLLGKNIHTEKTGVVAALFYGILSGAGSASHFQAANTEIFSMFWAVWAVVVYVIYGKKKWGLLSSGALVAVSFLFKQPGGLLLIVIALTEFGASSQTFKVYIRQIIRVIYGLAIVIIAVILFFWLKGGIYDLWMVGFWHNIVYMKGNSLLHGLRVAWKNIPFQIRGNYFFYLTGMIVFIGHGVTVVRRKIFCQFDEKKRQRYILFLGWFCTGWISVGLGWRFEGHYFFFVLPVIALLSAFFCVYLGAYLYRSINKVTIRIAVFSVFILICMGGIGYSLAVHSSGAFRLRRTYKVLIDADNAQGESIRQVARYIHNNTKAMDTVFVWGFCPQIYTLSDRRCASRFVFCNFLIGQMTGDEYFFNNTERLDRVIPGAWNYLIEDLLQKFPVYIVDTSPSNYFQYGNYPARRFKELRSFLNSFYTFETRIINMDVYRLDSSK